LFFFGTGTSISWGWVLMAGCCGVLVERWWQDHEAERRGFAVVVTADLSL